MNNAGEFNPNWASIPGDTIARILNDTHLSVDEFSKLIGNSRIETDLLLNGFTSIDENIAIKLHEILGGSIQFWLKREEKYNLAKEKLKETESRKWLSKLPLSDMKKNSWINSQGNIIEECLKFFKVPDVWTWEKKYRELIALSLFRKSSTLTSNPAAAATWLRQGEIQAEKIQCSKWNPEMFRESLVKMKNLSRQKDIHGFILKLRESCAECGVCLAVVPTPQGCAASGAAKFLSHEKAMIMLSFRFKTDDHMWFTFFHEAGHLILHDEKDVYIDEDIDEIGAERKENEANDFALEILFPVGLRNELQNMPINANTIKSIANQAGVSVGIVVGQLQHGKRISNAQFNKFKRKYDIKQILKEIENN